MEVSEVMGVPPVIIRLLDDHHLVLKPMVTWGFKKDGVKEGVDEELDGDIFWDLMRLQWFDRMGWTWTRDKIWHIYIVIICHNMS